MVKVSIPIIRRDPANEKGGRQPDGEETGDPQMGSTPAVNITRRCPAP